MKCIYIVNKQEYIQEVKGKAEESIFSQKNVGDNFVPIQISPLDILNKVIEHRRSPVYDQLCIDLAIAEYPKLNSSKSPIMIEENYFIEDTFETPNSEDMSEKLDNECNKMLKPKLHLYILVHGLGGNLTDMLSFKNHISFVDKNAEFIISCKNSANKSEKDINELAKNLSLEIDEELQFYDIRNVDKISFIGFSLGGIIIRAALPLISQYKAKFYSYISLATPHLGLKIKKKYIAAGLWFMKMFSNKKCLEQLNLDDSPDIHDTFMFQLSQSEGLSWFKKVYFFASSQDTYCPFGSARVQVFNEQVLDDNYTPEILEMAENILLKLNTESLTRVNTNFYISDSYLKTAIENDQKVVINRK